MLPECINRPCISVDLPSIEETANYSHWIHASVEETLLVKLSPH